MRAIIYARYSSDNQRDASIEDQIRVCRERAEREGWTIVNCYTDHAISGASLMRPGVQTLIRDSLSGKFDIVVTEALDRLSRDQEDIAGLYKRCRFAGVSIVTLTEGEITELHVGLKGTMNALFLKDLAEKTRRGLRGRIEAGASGGGLTYGYDVVDNDTERGKRQINTFEGTIVSRIFERYRDGQSPRRIVHALNRDGIPGPRSAMWTQSTINGNRARGTGILNNEVYRGRLVWNRLRYLKDPNTGKRRSRANAPEQVVVTEVPDLRIVDDELWQAVRDRQATLAPKTQPVEDGAQFFSKQRPRYLLSGLITCGGCGGGFSMISRTHLGCSAARNKGDAICANRRTVKRAWLEGEVLNGLKFRLMDPEIYKSFVAGFTEEWNKLQGERDAEQTAKRRELARAQDSIRRLVDAIEAGASVGPLKDRLTELDMRKHLLEAELAQAEAPAPRLMPNLAEVYRTKIADLHEAMNAPDADAVHEQIRSLIDEIRLVPDPEDPSRPLTVEIRGELAAMLALGDPMRRSGPGMPEGIAAQIKLVAGAGFEPAAFRL